MDFRSAVKSSAVQHGFGAVASGSTKTTYKFVCSKQGSEPGAYQKKPSCQWFISAKECADGRWVVEEANWMHRMHFLAGYREQREARERSLAPTPSPVKRQLIVAPKTEPAESSPSPANASLSPTPSPQPD